MDWKQFISEEFKKDYFQKLSSFVLEDSKNYTIYPEHKNIFNAFKFTPLDKVKAVILGQDPYHGPHQAHGLSFSVPIGIDTPPSLRNIYKELKSDLDIDIPNHGCLETWAKQGVLLLNTSLTVRQGQAGSHSKIGWEVFTDSAILILNSIERPLVFILWGAHARSKKKLITSDKHLILESAHPSPLSAHNGFFGSKPFSKTNNFLIQHNLSPIDWRM